MMALDDGAAHGQANSHAFGFRCVEGLKELFRGPGVETNSRIPNGQEDTLFPVRSGSDHHLPRAILDGAQGVCGVPQQVEDNLLKLYTITSH